MEIIVFEKEAYWKMQKDLIGMFQAALKEAQTPVDEWLNTTDTKKMLGVKSEGTMQKLRDNDEIKFSKRGTKLIMYSKESILNYLKRNVPSF